MVRETPRDALTVVSSSAAEDAGFVALCDVATIHNRPEFERALVIGGHMVSLHARRWGLDLFRETQDADLGVPQVALNNTNIVPLLAALGYTRVRANRFSRRVVDAGSDGAGDVGTSNNGAEAVIDI